MPPEMISHIVGLVHFEDCLALASTAKAWAAEVRPRIHQNIRLKTSTSSIDFFTSVAAPNIGHLIPYHSCIEKLTFEFYAIPSDTNHPFWALIRGTLGTLANLGTLEFEYSHYDPQALARLAGAGSSFPPSMTHLRMVPVVGERELWVGNIIRIRDLVLMISPDVDEQPEPI